MHARTHAHTRAFKHTISHEHMQVGLPDDAQLLLETVEAAWQTHCKQVMTAYCQTYQCVIADI